MAEGKRIVETGRRPGYMDLMNYVERELSKLVSLGMVGGGNPQFQALCSFNRIAWMDVEMEEGPSASMRLVIEFQRDVEEVHPLLEQDRQWLERYLVAALRSPKVEKGSYAAERLCYRFDMPGEEDFERICPPGYVVKYRWDGSDFVESGL